MPVTLISSDKCSVNPVDNLVRMGIFKAPAYPKTLGGDVAGIVEEADAGSKVRMHSRCGHMYLHTPALPHSSVCYL